MANIDTNSTLIASTTYFPTDKVIFSTTVNTSISNTSNASITQTLPTTANQAGPIIGIYSYDGGATYNEVGLYSVYNRAGSGTNVLPNVTITLSSNVDGSVTINGATRSTYGGGSTIPLIISLCILAPNNASLMPAIPTLGNTNKLAGGTTNPNGTPIANRRIIKTDNPEYGDQLYHSLPHGLSVPPDLFLWFTSSSGNITQPSLDTINTPGGTMQSSGQDMFTDATNLWISSQSISSGIDIGYRAYKP